MRRGHRAAAARSSETAGARPAGSWCGRGAAASRAAAAAFPARTSRAAAAASSASSRVSSRAASLASTVRPCCTVPPKPVAWQNILRARVGLAPIPTLYARFSPSRRPHARAAYLPHRLRGRGPCIIAMHQYRARQVGAQPSAVPCKPECKRAALSDARNSGLPSAVHSTVLGFPCLSCHALQTCMEQHLRAHRYSGTDA